MNYDNVPNLGLPLVFMYEGYTYSKEIDGLYHKFQPDHPRKPENDLGSITISKARELFATTKFIGSIIVLTDNVNLKV